MKYCLPIRRSTWIFCAAAALGAGACAFKESGYGVGPQAERAAVMLSTVKEDKPDTPGMYLALIDKMQARGLYYASLAHIDAYQKQYGANPESTLLRADALRMTGQPEASAAAYGALLKTPLAARGYRGLGLLAAAAGRFDEAARHLAQAAALAPTDAATLSDLGYARLRAGDVAGARVPLMQSVELDAKNARVLSNVALLLLAEGRDGQARALMEEERFPAPVREAIRQDMRKVAAAERARHGVQSSAASQAGPARGGAALASLRPAAATGAADVPPSLLQRFGQ